MRAGLAFSLLAVAGCAPLPAQMPPPATVIEGNWQILEVKRHVMPATPDFRLRFVSGRFSGRFGCNFMGGPYRLAGNLLHIGRVDSTRMACTEPGMTIERDAGLILAQPLIVSWTSPDHLELSNRAGGMKLSRLR